MLARRNERKCAKRMVEAKKIRDAEKRRKQPWYIEFTSARGKRWLEKALQDDAFRLGLGAKVFCSFHLQIYSSLLQNCTLIPIDQILQNLLHCCSIELLRTHLPQPLPNLCAFSRAVSRPIAPFLAAAFFFSISRFTECAYV